MSLAIQAKLNRAMERIEALENRVDLLVDLALALAADRKSEAVKQARLALVPEPDAEDTQEAS